MRCAKWVIAMLLLASIAHAQDDPTTHPIFPSAPYVDQLDNELTVVTVPWNTPGIVAYYTLVTVGARDEVEPGSSGFAHLFEHMMFRGTENFPGEEYQRTLQSFGADSNAYTTNDYTCYTITAPTTALAELVELEADRFQRLSYDEEGFRTETGAVLGEYNTDSSDPRTVMWERLVEMAFTEHTYGHTVLGYLRDVCAMPEMLDYSEQFFQRYYTPDNTTVIAIGDVTRDALLEMVQTHYGDWQGQRFDNDIPVEPEPTEGARTHIAWSGTTAPRIAVGFRVPAFAVNEDDPIQRAVAIRQSAALEVVRALAFHESSPLYQQLVVDEQLLMRLSSWPNDFSVDPSLFIVGAMLSPDDNFQTSSGFEPVLDAIQGELNRIAAGEVSAERITTVQSHIRYAFLSRLETPGRVAGTLAGIIAVGGNVEALVEYLDALEALTPEDVASAAATYFVPERRFVVTLATAAEGEQPFEPETCADYETEQPLGEEP